MTALVRADKALVTHGLARSRAEAQEMIAAGQVTIGDQVVGKASQQIEGNALLEVRGVRCPFVSRGGLKLAAALDTFCIDVQSKTALDIGASTGGFSDCLLQRDVRLVYAIDVGHGQLAPALSNNPNLIYREGINVRTLTSQDFPQCFDLIVVDLSFISLTFALPVLPSLLKSDGDIVCLVKPQFEVGPAKLGKGGVVRDAAVQKEALDTVQDAAVRQGLIVRSSMESPIVGGEGNREFLLWLSRWAGESPKHAE